MTQRKRPLKEVNVDRAKKIKTTIRSLKCELTEAEQRKIGLELAQCHKELNELDDEKAAAVKTFADKIKEKAGHISALAQTLNDGYETRGVDCEEIYDYQLGTVYLKRLDRGEVFNERPMTADERQVSFLQEQEDAQTDQATQAAPMEAAQSQPTPPQASTDQAG